MLNLKTIFLQIAALFIIMFSALSVTGKNPYMPATAFIPDGEPHVFTYKGETRVYIYGSRDEIVVGYCGYGHDVWSAPLNDLTDWTNHGEVFHLKQLVELGIELPNYDPVANTGTQNLAAPDCVYNPKTGKYYLYMWIGSGPRRVFVASSDSPTGPFIDPVECFWTMIGWPDPAVFIDDDGRVYAYWGGGEGTVMAEIDAKDMRTVIPGTLKTNVAGINKFFEASSMRKIGGKYVFVFSGGGSASYLSYSYADAPLGPFTEGGIIVSNSGASWGNYINGGNNHGGIFEANGQWYVAYHKATNNDYNRQARMEPIDLKIENGKVIIAQVPTTSQGVEMTGLNPFKRYSAGIYSYKEGNVTNEGSRREPDGLNPVVIKNNATVGFMYMNFGDKPLTNAGKLKLKLNASTKSAGIVEVYISDRTDNSNKHKIGQINFAADSAWHEIVGGITDIDACPVSLQGKRGLFFKFVGDSDGEVCRLKEFEFALGNNPTPNPLNNINLSNAKGGTFTAIPSKARKGESVKIVPKSEQGYALNDKTLKITCKGAKITVNRNADGSYEFKMPNVPVNVCAEFK